MEDLYKIETLISSSDDVLREENITASTFVQQGQSLANMLQFERSGFEIHGLKMSDLLKTQIANHPRYPTLVSSFIDCQKVGAPPEMTSLLEEIVKEKHYMSTHAELGADPELDGFMESYCEILQKLKDELFKPFDEATSFLSNITSQLSDLCGGTLECSSLENRYFDEEAAEASEEEIRCNEAETSEIRESFSVHFLDRKMKDMLLQRYGGYITNLRGKFMSGKRKKCKLPRDAKMILLEWWHAHYRWPYPTEEEKLKLCESTGLDHKQISNWFINHRKRHWKPSEGMRIAVVEDVSCSNGESMYLDFTAESRMQ